MRRMRFTIAALMTCVLLAAIGLAALRDPSQMWASAIFSMTVVCLLVSVLAAVARGGAARLACLGFLLFAGTYLVLSFGPWAWFNSEGLRPPPLITRLLLGHLREREPGLADRWQSHGTGIAISSNDVHFSVGPADTAVFASPGTPISFYNTVVPFDYSPYKQIAHSIIALIAGGLGAVTGRLLAPARSDRTERIAPA